MDVGYIPLSRKFFEHELWQEPRVFSRAEAFADLLRRTRFEANTSTILIGAQSVEIRRGEVVASIRFLAKNWGWSKNKVDKFLDYLVDNGMITKRKPYEIEKGTRKGTVTRTAPTIIKLCNFDKYNPISSKAGHKKGHESGHERDTKGTILNKDNTGNNTYPPLSPLKGETKEPAVPQSADSSTTPKRKEKVARKRKELDLSFVEPSFQPIMADWLAYKSERGQTYQQRGVKSCYSHLLNLSGGDVDIARQIVEQSTANNYSGLFPLKQTNDVRSTTYQPSSHRASNGDITNEEVMRRCQERVAERLAREKAREMGLYDDAVPDPF